MNLFLKS